MSKLHNPLFEVYSYKMKVIKELERIAETCKGSYAEDRLLWDSHQQEGWLKGDWHMRYLLQSMRYQPQSPQEQGYAPQGGVFAGLPLDKILEICFTPEATAFLLEHAYNGCVFWENLRRVVVIDQECELPYTLDVVRKVLVIGLTPFGIPKCSNSTIKMAKLREAVLAAGGKFDPAKLDATHACELLDDGFLLLHRGELVVNPMWTHVIDELAAPAPTEPSHKEPGA